MKPLAIAALALLAAWAGRDAAGAETAHGVYTLHCSGCHGREGAGSRTGRIPPFQTIVGRFALEPEGRRYLVLVPGVATSGLSDADKARVLNYVLDAWGGADAAAAPRFSADEVGRLRAARVDDISALRRAVAARLALRGLPVEEQTGRAP